MKNFYKLTIGLLLCLSTNPSYSSDTDAKGFEDLGDSFKYKHDYTGPYKYKRSDFINFVDYAKADPKNAAASIKYATLVFGGGHLTAEEAFELNKDYARKGDSLHLNMFRPGCHNHLGHTVINIDPTTNPDFVADFTEDRLVHKLKLGDHNLVGKYDMVVLENLKWSAAYALDTLRNAYDALKPTGLLIIDAGAVRAEIIGHQVKMGTGPLGLMEKMILSEAGFFPQELNNYGDIFTARMIPQKVIVACKNR